MMKSGKLVLLFSLWVIFDRGNGINGMDINKGMQSEVKFPQRLRYRRNSDCHLLTDDNGYVPLTKNKVQVKFYKQGDRYYATATWQKPKVRNLIPISGFVVYWSSIDEVSDRDCKVVEDKTSLNITPSHKWPIKDILLIEIIPLPVRSSYTSAELPTFFPKYKDISNKGTPEVKSPDVHNNVNDTSVLTSTKIARNNTNNIAIPENNSKIVIGAVSGVAMGIVLIVILIVCYRRYSWEDDDPKRNPSGPYYVSYCPENDETLRKVDHFVSWLRKKGFDVEADCMLSEDNVLLTKEIGRIRIRDKLLGQAKNVFMIVSPSYLRLCRLDEQVGKSGQDKPMVDSLSLEEKIVYNEIMYIRYDLLSTVSRNDRFIPILFCVDEAKLPYWIKDLLLYTWPDEKEKERLLYRLDNKPEYLPAKPEVAV